MTKDETPPGSSGWSVDTALQHVLSLMGANDHRYEQRFLDQDRAVTNALAAAKEAVIKAEQAAEKRFDAVNEFRATLADQQRTLMPRAESDRAFEAMEQKLVALEKQLDAVVAERRGAIGGWGYAVGVVGFVFLVVSLIALIADSTP